MDLLEAIQGVGSAIDKTTGGRAVRGLLAGKPRELLSPIPFSDSMGLTDSKDSTSGRDLTDAYGITSKNDNGWGASAAGFLADNVLSPANMIGGYGAFKAAPTLSKGVVAGAKAATGADLLDHIASAGKSVGNFLADEAGSLKVPVKSLRGSVPGGSLPKSRFAGPAMPDDVSWAKFLESGEKPSDAAKKIAGDFGFDARLADSSEFTGHPNAFAAYNSGFKMGFMPMPPDPGFVPHILLNKDYDAWRDPISMRNLTNEMHNIGHFSSAGPNHLIYHELGHALHQKYGKNFISATNRKLDPAEADTLSNLVSTYGATQPVEAVAEITGPLLAGREFNQGKKIAPILKYHGSGLYDYLGDNGYLKGLGLSGLLAATLSRQTQGTNPGEQ